MPQVLSYAGQNENYQEVRPNQIAVFKSCFPNNSFRSEGTPPGDSNASELTVWNAKACYTALLDEFRKQPKFLFFCVTVPLVAPKTSVHPVRKMIAKKVLDWEPNLAASAPLAFISINRLVGINGWLKDSALTNVIMFDYYDILTR